MLNPFELLVGGVAVFIVARVLFWILVQIPQGHAKDEAICEKCLGKKMNDKVTEELEWCNCPLRETSDKHNRPYKHYHNECPDCQAGVGCTVCDKCAPWLSKHD